MVPVLLGLPLAGFATLATAVAVRRRAAAFAFGAGFRRAAVFFFAFAAIVHPCRNRPEYRARLKQTGSCSAIEKGRPGDRGGPDREKRLRISARRARSASWRQRTGPS